MSIQEHKRKRKPVQKRTKYSQDKRNPERIRNASNKSNVIKMPIRKKKTSSIVYDKLIQIFSGKSKNPALFIIFGVILVLFIIWAFVHKNGQEVYVGDIKVGILRDMEVKADELYQTALAKLKSEKGTNVEVNEKILLKYVHASKKEIASTDYILAEICKTFTYKVEASSITVDGIEMALLKNAEEANAILEQIKEKYKIKEENSNIVETTFVQDVKVTPKFVNNDEIMLAEKAQTILTTDSKVEKKYKVAKNDTLWKIAINAEMTLDELIKVNPGLTENSVLKLGQELNLIVPVPLLSVKTVEQIKYTAVEPKKVEQVKNDNEYKTYKKVIQQGKDGQKEVTANIIRVDGIEQQRVVVSENVTLAPLTEKIEIGTLQTPPKRAIGSFIYPVYGRMTSTFGKRWNSIHKGIDIASSKNSKVFASDGGTVIKSEWNTGGYGNLVVIDHGNGFQTYYGHNSSNAVKVGQKVAQGEVIAYVGSTGNSTGNHVHFEIRKNDVPLNPFDYIK